VIDRRNGKLTCSRTFLSKGPSAAKVENVEYYKDVKGADENVINKYMGGREAGPFEVR